MPQTRPNKVKVPVNSDAWNPTGDLATMADTILNVINVPDQATRDALAATFPGGTLPVPTTVWRVDLDHTETWNGTEWVGAVRHAEWTFPSQSVPNNAAYGPGIGTIDTTRSQYQSVFSQPANDKWTVSKAGVYSLGWYQNWGGQAGPCFFAIDKGGHLTGQQFPAAYEHTHTFPNMYLKANETIQLIFVQTSGVTLTGVSHRVNLTKVG